MLRSAPPHSGWPDSNSRSSKSALFKCPSARLQPRKFAPRRFLRLSLVELRSGRVSGSFCRHLFHTVTPLLRMSKCSGLAMFKYAVQYITPPMYSQFLSATLNWRQRIEILDSRPRRRATAAARTPAFAVPCPVGTASLPPPGAPRRATATGPPRCLVRLTAEPRGDDSERSLSSRYDLVAYQPL